MAISVEVNKYFFSRKKLTELNFFTTATELKQIINVQDLINKKNERLENSSGKKGENIEMQWSN